MSLYHLLPNGMIEALGWTLLHSLWQGLVTLGLVLILLKYIPSAASGYRYGVALAGLTLTWIAGIATFILLYNKSEIIASSSGNFAYIYYPVSQGAATSGSILTWLLTAIQQNLSWLVMAWLAGALLFMFRVVGGGIYVSRLRNGALPITGYWYSRVQELASQLNISLKVSLAESARIQAPVVLGYLKPLIVVPVGMLSGLTAEQLETIFIHELTHIRRHDYLINLFQLILEAIFFFNPFVWKLSSIVRDEREHCCDDAVVRTSGNTAAYALALVQLEEARLSQSGIALSLADNKNQLLNRIKRLMEKSVKHYSGRERIIPVVLLVLGLFCASWLTVSSNKKDRTLTRSSFVIAQDTTIKARKKDHSPPAPVAVPSEPAELQEIAVDVQEAPEAVQDIEAPEAMPPVPDIPFPNIAVVAPVNLDFQFHMDTVPPLQTIRFDHDMDNFAEEFEKSFKETFGDFYKTHQLDFDKMMTDIKVKMENIDSEALQHIQVDAMAQMKLAQENMVLARQQAMIAQEDAMHQLKRAQEMQQIQMRDMQADMKVLRDNMQRFEQELKEELVKDGYLKDSDKIQNMEWNNGNLEVNGIKIKEAHLPKYRKLHDEFFSSKYHAIHKLD